MTNGSYYYFHFMPRHSVNLNNYSRVDYDMYYRRESKYVREDQDWKESTES